MVGVFLEGGQLLLVFLCLDWSHYNTTCSATTTASMFWTIVDIRVVRRWPP